MPNKRVTNKRATNESIMDGRTPNKRTIDRKMLDKRATDERALNERALYKKMPNKRRTGDCLDSSHLCRLMFGHRALNSHNYLINAFKYLSILFMLMDFACVQRDGLQRTLRG